jgi:crossover junction endodeoxyribonuclease RuvC
VVSSVTIREPTHEIRIWDEVSSEYDTLVVATPTTRGHSTRRSPSHCGAIVSAPRRVASISMWNSRQGDESRMVRLLGIDPGLRFTGWGLVEANGNHLRHVADGVIATDAATSVPSRLKALHDALLGVLCELRPDEAAVEETYVNRNGVATLKLGYARGVALLAPALLGIPVTEYGAKAVKMAVVGTGGAEKGQVQMMVRQLLPGAATGRADAADALAVAICHAHHRASRLAWGRGVGELR